MENFGNILYKLLSFKISEEEEVEKKKDGKEGIQLVGAVIDFVKEMDSEVKMDISANISTILKQVSIIPF